MSLIMLALLSGCANEDIGYRFVAEGSTEPLSLMASEARSFVCVVAVYRASSSSKPPALAIGFEPWSVAPLTERTNEMAIEMRALKNAAGCWSEEIREASGSSDPWHYLIGAKPLTSFDHGGNIAMFDPQRNIFIAVSG
ncbi:hypothetical protein [uncultured Paracoccus sp.]|uniref:hypothetical protein n=1 Tax=uncultured Paracoccus sp. TaxID=189685 RepID=UPI0025E70CF4|nr:hypothetical protein [uncultured Paracoccus sp.]